MLSDSSVVQIYSLRWNPQELLRSAAGNRNIQKVSSTVGQWFASTGKNGCLREHLSEMIDGIAKRPEDAKKSVRAADELP
jgi:hypothetical protein